VTDLQSEALAVAMRMLAQILIKVQAGPQWGADEAEVMRLTRVAESHAKILERGDTSG
jgi:hypothetical protein